MEKDGVRLTGKIAAERIGQVAPRRPDPALIRELEKIDDLTGAVSDALDALGVSRVVPGCLMRSSIPGSRIIGPALTVRNVRQEVESVNDSAKRVARHAEIEAHNLAKPGDVLVVEGITGISNMGGLSSTIGKRVGELGAVVDGSFRDMNRSRELDYPIWSNGPSPISAKYRIETVLINQRIHIHGVQVDPGDLVVADDTGVAFIPCDLVPEVLKRVKEIEAAEARRRVGIDRGDPVPDLAILQ
jgi:4-hydroxy-4-methyl-2-oxoglutarate aldolase